MGLTKDCQLLNAPIVLSFTKRRKIGIEIFATLKRGGKRHVCLQGFRKRKDRG